MNLVQVSYVFFPRCGAWYEIWLMRTVCTSDSVRGAMEVAVQPKRSNKTRLSEMVLSRVGLSRSPNAATIAGW